MTTFVNTEPDRLNGAFGGDVCANCKRPFASHNLATLECGPFNHDPLCRNVSHQGDPCVHCGLTYAELLGETLWKMERVPGPPRKTEGAAYD